MFRASHITHLLSLSPSITLFLFRHQTLSYDRPQISYKAFKQWGLFQVIHLSLTQLVLRCNVPSQIVFLANPSNAPAASFVFNVYFVWPFYTVIAMCFKNQILVYNLRIGLNDGLWVKAICREYTLVYFKLQWSGHCNMQFNFDANTQNAQSFV